MPQGASIFNINRTPKTDQNQPAKGDGTSTPQRPVAGAAHHLSATTQNKLLELQTKLTTLEDTISNGSGEGIRDKALGETREALTQLDSISKTAATEKTQSDQTIKSLNTRVRFLAVTLSVAVLAAGLAVAAAVFPPLVPLVLGAVTGSTLTVPILSGLGGAVFGAVGSSLLGRRKQSPEATPSTPASTTPTPDDGANGAAGSNNGLNNTVHSDRSATHQGDQPEVGDEDDQRSVSVNFERSTDSL